MGAILRVSRSRQHALTTALRVDMAYLCVDVRTVLSLLLAPLFSVIFQGEAYGDGFGYRMGVIMTVFTCAMWVLTMAVADLQNGYRLRGIIPSSRKNQVAARYVVGLVISVLSVAMIVLIDGVASADQSGLVIRGQSVGGAVGRFLHRADGRAYRAHGLSVDQTRRSSSHDDGDLCRCIGWIHTAIYFACFGDQRIGPCRECHHRATIVAGYCGIGNDGCGIWNLVCNCLSHICFKGMVTMSWKSVVKQCRFDCVGTGLFSVANMVFLLVFPVLSIVVSLVTIPTHVDEHVASGLMGGLGGLASAMACMSALGPASSEESAGHSAMRGLIPVSRTAQVVGRYLFLLVVGLLWALDVVICGGVFIVFGDIADMGWIGTLAAGAFIFALAIILGSVLLACAYRFTFRKMMVASVAVMVGLYAVIALLARLPVDWQWLLLNITDFLTIWWHTALVLAVLCLLAYFGSMLIAIRIYRAKEL